MAAITVDPQRFAEGAGFIAGTQGEVLRAVQDVARGLAGGNGMAGNDPAAQDWAKAYDPAAAKLLALSSDLANRLGDHVRALNEAGAAYQASEAWFGGTFGALAPATAHADSTVPMVPEAQGGTPFASSDPVMHLLIGAVGMVWPNGDTGRLRAASGEWSAMAVTLETARKASLASAASCLGGMSSPTVSAAADREREFDGAMTDLGSGATDLAAACRDLATHIDDAHNDAWTEARNLAIELGVTVAISGLTAIFTAGLSTVIGGAATAGRVALAVRRITTLFERLASAARTVASRIGRIAEALSSLAGRMGRWTVTRLPAPARRLTIGRVADTLEKLTDNWVVKLATEGPGAALGKILEKPVAAYGGRRGQAAARRALVLGWRSDAPGVRGRREAADRALDGAQSLGALTRVGKVVDKAGDLASSPAQEGIKGAAASQDPAEKEREPVTKKVGLLPGAQLDVSDKKLTVASLPGVELSALGPAGKLVSSGLTIANASDVNDTWGMSHLQSGAHRPTDAGASR